MKRRLRSAQKKRIGELADIGLTGPQISARMQMPLHTVQRIMQAHRKSKAHKG